LCRSSVTALAVLCTVNPAANSGLDDVVVHIAGDPIPVRYRSQPRS
jgi:hypothetical protein